MMEAATKLLFVVSVYCLLGVELVFSDTDPQDAAALVSLKSQWQNVPPSWGKNDTDPCGAPWEGVTCKNSSVTSIKLSSMNLKGTLTGDIGQLSHLQILDLSQNKGLTGPIPPQIGDLKELNILILIGCSFNGIIPPEIGHLYKLSFLSLNSNKFNGKIPATLGNLTNLYWLDLADNELEGTLPVSSADSPFGLDQLIKAQYLHFSNNKLSDVISGTLFNEKMVLLHVLLDGNNLTGEIPKSLGYVKPLEVLRLDRNNLTMTFPSTFVTLTSLRELNLANNQLVGLIPDLTNMNALSYVDMSNNRFDISTAPTWFSTLKSLTTLILENANLTGTVPSTLFELPQLQQVKMRRNKFKKLDMNTRIGAQLQLVDIQDNQITNFVPSGIYKHTLLLSGNTKVCGNKSDKNYCTPQELRLVKSYSTSLGKCETKGCESNDMKVDPRNCNCAFPFSGTMYFGASFFGDLSNATIFQELESSLSTKLELSPGSVFLENPSLNGFDYIQIKLYLFPTPGPYFNRTEIQRLGFYISINHTLNHFGPYSFTAFPYDFQDGKGGTPKTPGKDTPKTPGKDGSSASLGLILGIVSGCVLLIVILILVRIYVVPRMKKADKMTENSKSLDFAASWEPRWFTFAELKKCTKSFHDSNEVGSGAYGKEGLAYIWIGRGGFA